MTEDKNRIKPRIEASLLGHGRLLLLLLLLAAALACFITTRPERGVVSEAERDLRPKAKPKPAEPKFALQPVQSFSFSDESALDDWKEKVFKGRVLYELAKDRDQSFVSAKSDAAASALYHKIGLDPKRSPVITWKWRVDKFPVKTKQEELESQAEHDFAGRMYVIFPTFFVLNSKVLEYIWAKDLPVGTTGTSPYSKNIKLIVLQTGPSANGEWRFEERDIVADYIKAFGQSPDRDIGAVSFMTNAEHTGSTAEAAYDEINIGYKKEKTGGRL